MGIDPSLFSTQALLYCQWMQIFTSRLFFFSLPFHFVDVIITYLGAPKNYKVNNGQHQCQYCVFLHCNFVPFAKYTNPAQIEQYLMQQME